MRTPISGRDGPWLAPFPLLRFASLAGSAGPALTTQSLKIEPAPHGGLQTPEGESMAKLAIVRGLVLVSTLLVLTECKRD